jgi:hypothetical protein
MRISREKKIKKLLQLFAKYPVLVDGTPAGPANMSPVTGDGENQVVSLAWEEKRVQFLVLLTEDGIANADILGNSLDIEDHEGDPINIEFTGIGDELKSLS